MRRGVRWWGAQHIGLNALSASYAVNLPRCEEVFKEGELALLEGIALALEAGDRPAAVSKLAHGSELAG